MSYKYRGIALIIVNLFENNTELARTNAIDDCKRMTKLFKDLDFKVKEELNVNFQRMEELIDEAKKWDFDYKPECFVCVISSHGDELRIGESSVFTPVIYTEDAIGQDRNFLYVNELISHFSEKNCTFYEGMPKLFFIQACRTRYGYDHLKYDPGQNILLRCGDNVHNVGGEIGGGKSGTSSDKTDCRPFSGGVRFEALASTNEESSVSTATPNEESVTPLTSSIGEGSVISSATSSEESVIANVTASTNDEIVIHSASSSEESVIATASTNDEIVIHSASSSEESGIPSASTKEESNGPTASTFDKSDGLTASKNKKSYGPTASKSKPSNRPTTSKNKQRDRPIASESKNSGKPTASTSKTGTGPTASTSKTGAGPTASTSKTGTVPIVSTSKTGTGPIVSTSKTCTGPTASTIKDSSGPTASTSKDRNEPTASTSIESSGPTASTSIESSGPTASTSKDTNISTTSTRKETVSSIAIMDSPKNSLIMYPVTGGRAAMRSEGSKASWMFSYMHEKREMLIRNGKLLPYLTSVVDSMAQHEFMPEEEETRATDEQASGQDQNKNEAQRLTPELSQNGGNKDLPLPALRDSTCVQETEERDNKELENDHKRNTGAPETAEQNSSEIQNSPVTLATPVQETGGPSAGIATGSTKTIPLKTTKCAAFIMHRLTSPVVFQPMPNTKDSETKPVLSWMAKQKANLDKKAKKSDQRQTT